MQPRDREEGERRPMREQAPLFLREASANDVEAVRACVFAAFDLYTERIGKPPGPMLLDFQAQIAAGHVWFAESRGAAVGVLVQYETEQGFYIDTVAVAPPHQGRGVAKALLGFAEQEALRRGYDSIYLCTNVKMTENQAFYPRMGYVEYERKFDGGYDRIFYRKSLARR
ncbi:MAG TPA: GNAT family N-acetyltransferase [Anaerolineales bacterium]|nr:GNAT family N-acetyltransferase [Anaerolineales bacterium]